MPSDRDPAKPKYINFFKKGREVEAGKQGEESLRNKILHSWEGTMKDPDPLGSLGWGERLAE